MRTHMNHSNHPNHPNHPYPSLSCIYMYHDQSSSCSCSSCSRRVIVVPLRVLLPLLIVFLLQPTTVTANDIFHSHSHSRSHSLGRARLDSLAEQTNYIDRNDDDDDDDDGNYGVNVNVNVDLSPHNNNNFDSNVDVVGPQLVGGRGLYQLNNAGRFLSDVMELQHQQQHQQQQQQNQKLPNNNIQLLLPNNNNHDTNTNINTNTNKKANYRTLKTGTTIVGIKTKHHIIIAADTRATEGTIVADKKCSKVHQITNNIWCCGAGTSADLDALTRQVRYTYLLKSMIQDNIGNDNVNGRMNNNGSSNDVVGQQISISAICTTIRETLYKSNGSIGANLVLGGYDPYTNEPILTSIHPHGSIDVIPYTALGSGGLAAMGILESRYGTYDDDDDDDDENKKENGSHASNISLTDGIELVKDAVRAGIENDLGSGSQIDLCIIGKDGVTYQKGVMLEEILPLSDGDEDVNQILFLKHTSGSSTTTSSSSSSSSTMTEEEKDNTMTMSCMDGVNGFGSVPYSIKSQTKLLEDEMVVENRDDEWLKKILNL